VLVYSGPSGVIQEPVTSAEWQAPITSSRPPVAGFSSLDVGEVAETGVHGEVYNRPGPVSFALAPHSRIEVVANDFEEGPKGGITFALARGSILASVTQHSEGEIFAVEVEHTRIAAHGTSFSVTREGDRVIVEVTQGSVAVGPIGRRGSTHGWLVAANDRAAFSLDGAREATWLGPETPPPPVAAVEPSVELPPTASSDVLAPRAKHSPTTLATSSMRADAVAASTKSEILTVAGAAPKVVAWGEGTNLEGRDASEQEAAAMSAIVRQLEACYEQQVGASGVRVSVESSLRLTLLPSGAIREGVFTPPLSPTLMSCANQAIGTAHFPKGEAARQIRIPVQLSRAAR
jgi:hypothetical protein